MSPRPKFLTSEQLVIVFVFMSAMFSVGIYMILANISNDTMYIRQTIQLDEEPIDPFCIVTIERLRFEDTLNSQWKDTLYLLCEPDDTTTLKVMLRDLKTECCSAVACVKDSVTQVSIEYVE